MLFTQSSLSRRHLNNDGSFNCVAHGTGYNLVYRLGG